MKGAFKIFSFLLISLAVMSYTIVIQATSNASSNSTLTVVVQGLRNSNSQICLRVFSGQKGFPFEASSEVQSTCTRIADSSVTKQFQGLKPGIYAVAAIDDKNKDLRLNRNPLGIPQEGFGLSNNPSVSVFTGVPKFKDASFHLKQNTTISVFMKYSLD